MSRPVLSRVHFFRHASRLVSHLLDQTQVTSLASYIVQLTADFGVFLIHYVRFRSRKVLCTGVSVGNISMEEKQNFQNVNMSIKFLVSFLKK
ncbi:hypothetical protein AALP_AA7G038400 [Arabis alpina]|uniref:Uncharacterized protein n=1 Tax=Arabis alpina TaxID=50452 RepID=A0A087GFR8_ARAAL|nr:hypothetical protein AALP_AA7G038400 [Arabis alpina]